MSLDREMLKLAMTALLDTIGAEHALKHQPSKARRYTICAKGGTPVELMLERGPKCPPNLWILASVAAGLPGGKPSPSKNLRMQHGKDGKLLYARHSSLENMPQLGNADLVCFAPKDLQETGAVLDQVLIFSAAGRAP